MVRQGHIIWIELDPQAGHEQRGRRPALVVSRDSFNISSSQLAFVCPITSADKRNPFHVELDGRTKTSGFIMCDQMRSIDFKARNYKFIEVIPQDILSDVLDTVGAIIF
jgi:mRNA interferase MazF